MSYTPVNWQTGEIITAVRLNKMDNGWGIDNTQLFSETVTTIFSENLNRATLNYNVSIDYPTITVIFNNIEYTCERIDAFNQYFYGGFSESGPDFSVYPFVISSAGAITNEIYTSTEGTFSVTVMTNVINISNNFQSAVSYAVNRTTPLPFLCANGLTTYDEMISAVSLGRLLYFYYNNICHFITHIRGEAGDNVIDAVPAAVEGAETYGFNNDKIFTIYQS